MPSENQRFLAALLATVPPGAAYEEQARLLEELTHDVRRQVAARLLPALKDRIPGQAAPDP